MEHMAESIHLSKHHGLGNDFLVCLFDHLPGDAPARAIAWCDRHTGIGADGVIFGLPAAPGSGSDIVMRLLNSDGSAAEISGNGLRCFAQAVARQQGRGDVRIDVSTPAGNRSCDVHATDDPATVMVTVDMGTVRSGPDPDAGHRMAASAAPFASVKRWETGDIGNPHVVCEVDDPDAIDLQVVGPAIESLFAAGANVHFAAVSGDDELSIRVWERGAGITNACGSGAVVAADVFHRWGLVGRNVIVHMPGGNARVDIGDSLRLTGPAVHIADVVVADR